MPTYDLNTSFGQADLERFYASGTNIVVAKPTGGGMPDVAWVVYRPLAKNNIKWNEEYGIYASTTDIQNGASIQKMSSTGIPASIGKMYDFGPSGYFGPPTSGGIENAYSVYNGYDNLSGKGYLTIGLTQDANVDGGDVPGNVTSAAAVLYNSKASMTPYTTVYIWTQSQIKSNTVVTNVTSEMTQINFGGGTSTVDLVYDASSWKFLPADGKKLADGLEVKHIAPTL
jgi:hypothetical protein